MTKQFIIFIGLKIAEIGTILCLVGMLYLVGIVVFWEAPIDNTAYLKAMESARVVREEYLNRPKEGTYLHGGTIVTIKRLDYNDDWITINGGRYKYRVDCKNCGECWHVGYGDDARCYMISESWEQMEAKRRGE